MSTYGEAAGIGGRMDAALVGGGRLREGVKFHGHYAVECWATRPGTLLGRVREIGWRATLEERGFFKFHKGQSRLYHLAQKLRALNPKWVHRIKTHLKWREEIENLVVNEGLDHLLDVALSGGTQDTSWFVGLLAASPSPAAGWTAASLAAVDFVAYSEATLQAFTDGGVSGQSLDNSASKAVFSINADTSSIGGAFLIGTNAKATPAGTLYSAGAFSGGNKAADNGDSLEVTATFTAADDGV